MAADMKLNIIHRASLALLAAVLTAAGAASAADADAQALHVLNRLAYGPRPGDVERVAGMGVQRWIDRQLHPETIPLPPDLGARLAALDTVNRSAGESLAEFLELRRDVRMDDEGAKQRRREAALRVARQAAEARLLRAVH